MTYSSQFERHELILLGPILIGVDLAASRNGFRFETSQEILQTLVLVGMGGVLAFAMEVAEFAIVQMASSLTLSIIGVTKVRVSDNAVRITSYVILCVDKAKC